MKKNIEGFEERCISFEKEFNKDYFDDVIYRIEGDKYEQLIESIVELADVISVKQYGQTFVSGSTGATGASSFLCFFNLPFLSIE